MKAKDLIEFLQRNPEADVLIDCAPNFHPVEAGVYEWGEYIFVLTEQSELASAQLDAEEIQSLREDC